MAETSHSVILSQTPWDGRGREHGWVGRLSHLAAVLFLEQPSHVLAVIEPGNIRLHQSFPAASRSAQLVVVKTSKFEIMSWKYSTLGSHLLCSLPENFIKMLEMRFCACKISCNCLLEEWVWMDLHKWRSLSALAEQAKPLLTVVLWCVLAG